MATITIAGITITWPHDLDGLDVSRLLAPACVPRGVVDMVQQDDNGPTVAPEAVAPCVRAPVNDCQRSPRMQREPSAP